MSNHVHLLIKPLKGENLSRIMQWILSVFAIYYNKINGLVGHVWLGRFGSKIIKSTKQLINAFKYVSENPVNAGLVNNAFEYKFNGIVFIKLKNFDVIEKPLKFLENLYEFG